VSGLIITPSQSILSQVVEFEMRGNASASAELLTITASRVPANVDLEIFINGNSRFLRASQPAANSSTLFTARRIVALKRNATTLYPPAIVEVRTWQ
jgi:hypothetical protein